MKILSTRKPEIKELVQYLQSHPEKALETAIGIQQKYLVVSSEYQKLQTEYLKLKAQRKSTSVSPVFTLILSFIASVRITKLSWISGRKTWKSVC